jgi:hypothetical protein
MDDDIEFLRDLGQDLRAAAGRERSAHAAQRRLVALAPIAVVAVVAAVVLATVALERNESHGPARSHGPLTSALPTPTPHNRASTLPVPNFGPALPPTGPELNGIAATGPDNVWAVGENASLGRSRSIVEHFDGRSWHKVSVPNIGRLVGVTAATPSAAWAVGEGRKILRWDGEQWAVQTLPKVNGIELDAVDASGPDDVWAVGTRWGAHYGRNSVGNATLTVHWDGSHWSVIPSPDPVVRDNDLSGVVAEATDDAWAVGSINHRGLTIHWNGIRWSVVPLPHFAPHFGKHYSALWAAGDDGQGGVWAVGQYSHRGHGYGAHLYIRWTGQSWQVVPGASDGRVPSPTAISGSSASDLWAVGSAAGDRMMVARYDGGRWRDVRVSVAGLPRGYDANLADVVTLSPTNAWAVGVLPVASNGRNSRQTSLVMHWDGTDWRRFPVSEASAAR